MHQGHLLKFIHQTDHKPQHPTGIRTYPQQTYGLSQESPEEWKQQFTLTADHSYCYRHENRPEFYYPSQKKSFDVHRGVEEEDYTRLHLKLLRNSQAFHRKKGRLSEFMDRNGWMSPVVSIMGFERTPAARQLSNRDREQRIKSQKGRTVYENSTKQPKVNQDYFNTISSLMSQKLKIRKERNKLKQLQPLSSRAEPRRQKQKDPILIQNVMQSMAKTNQDFYSTSSTFYPRNSSRAQSRNSNDSPSKITLRSSLNKRTQSPTKSSKGPSSPNKRMPDVIDRQDQNVQQWYRDTCQGKWTYKPKDINCDDDF